MHPCTHVTHTCTLTGAWKKNLKKHCDSNNHGTEYSSLGSAEAACASKGSACAGVYDVLCKGTTFKLCKPGQLSTSQKSCVLTRAHSPHRHHSHNPHSHTPHQHNPHGHTPRPHQRTASCRDRKSSCAGWKTKYRCNTDCSRCAKHTTYIKNNCAKTCLIPDKSTSCAGWKMKHGCNHKTFASYIKARCATTCNLC